MIDDDHYMNLPDNPELAFLEIEKSVKKTLEARLDGGDNNSPYTLWYREYINKVIAAARTLNVNGFEYLVYPKFGEDEIYTYYQDFSNYVMGYVMELRIRYSSKVKQHSIPLDSATKEKIRHHLGQMKTLCDRLELSTEKKEIILRKISDLEIEMTRERTRFEIYAGLSLATASIAGEIGDKVAPLRKLFDSISNLLGKAKDSEAQQYLPAPKEMKKIEPPKVQTNASEIDDDVPF